VRELVSFVTFITWRRFDPVKLRLKASTLTDLSQYVSPGRRAYCYAELSVSSPGVAETTSTHCTYLRRDGQAELPEKYRDNVPTKSGLTNPNTSGWLL